MNVPNIYARPLKQAALIFAAACLIGFLAHQAFDWMPALFARWLDLRKDRLMAIEHFQQLGLLTLGLAGATATTIALGREPVLSGRLYWQSGLHVLYGASAFVGVIVGLAISVAVKQGLSAALSGFLLALAAAFIAAMILGLSLTILQFPHMAFRSQRAVKYRREIAVALGLFVAIVATWGLCADLLASPAPATTVSQASHP